MISSVGTQAIGAFWSAGRLAATLPSEHLPEPPATLVDLVAFAFPMQSTRRSAPIRSPRECESSPAKKPCFRPEKDEERLDLTGYMSYMDAEGRACP